MSITVVHMCLASAVVVSSYSYMPRVYGTHGLTMLTIMLDSVGMPEEENCTEYTCTATETP